MCRGEGAWDSGETLKAWLKPQTVVSQQNKRTTATLSDSIGKDSYGEGLEQKQVSMPL